MFSIEIVNIILNFVSELNNNTITTQYCLITNKEYYKINFYSKYLWKIKSNLHMKQLYPILSYPFSNKGDIELYKSGSKHYEQKLKEI